MDVVANYTPDVIDWYHGGASGSLEPGKLKEFETGRANYLVNKFGPRGILRMKFGDNIDDAKKAAMRKWEEFWTRQVVIFNQDNERRQNTNREYVYPTKQLQEHADRVGLKLLGPWTLRNLPPDDAKVRTLQTDNESLRVEVQELKEMVKALLQTVKADNSVPDELRTPTEKIVLSQKRDDEEKKEASPEKDEAAEIPDMSDHKALLLEFQMLQRDKFLAWISENATRIQSPEYPAEVRTLMTKKWEKLMGDGNFPLPA